jgi:hypothetical protein
MKKMLVLIAALFLAMPMVASADLVGDCYDCHTMHNSEQGIGVITVNGAVNTAVGPGLPNLLKYDCMSCHAQDPTTGTKNWTGPGGSVIPQVAHGDATDLAGGNFNQTTARKVHSVVDVVNAGISPAVPLGEVLGDAPPGIYNATSNHHGVFTEEGAADAFDMFTCAGARGCHGSRSQVVAASTVDNGTANNWVITERRVGMAAISGAHHNNIDNAKTGTGYNNLPAVHDGDVVADGYRFIVGLQGFENTAREYVSGTDHNEYYGVSNGMTAAGTGCAACHVQDTAQSNTRAGFASGIVSINNSMSGFCSSCHGYFHSAGGVGANADLQNNGTSGAFLRHPSDYVIPSSGEYQYYTVYDETAPVARDTVLASANGTVTPGDDMVMCLSCHVAHGSANDYLLRFDYGTMTAGAYGSEVAAQAVGGCLACHTSKGVLPQNRVNP